MISQEGIVLAAGETLTSVVVAVALKHAERLIETGLQGVKL